MQIQDIAIRAAAGAPGDLGSFALWPRRCSYFGNVRVGVDVSVSELRELYNVILLAYGAEADRDLGIPGESLSGVIPAREFVW